MALGDKDLLEILKLLEKSEWDELRLETPSFKLTVAKKGRPMDGAVDPPPPRASSSSVSIASAPTIAPAVPAAAVRDDAVVPPGVFVVPSPTLGNFYVAPKPGAPPFVLVGDRVGPDDTVAIVEVMKLMNHVAAGTGGTILKVCAQNGELVEYGQALFWIDPTAHGQSN